MVDYNSLSDAYKSIYEAAKAKKDFDGDGEIESGAKEHAGAVHNAIQKKRGLKPDGKDTTGIKEEEIVDEDDLLDENRRMARDPEGRNSGHSKQPDPSKDGFTGIGNMSIDQIRKMSARIDKEKTKKEEVEYVDEKTAMAKRGYDEAPIRRKIAKSTGGGKSADRATDLENRSTYGDAKKAKQRQDYARKQRGDFRKTTSSSPGLHGYAHKSNDPAVKAKQAARGAQRGALTPAERKNLNMGDEVAQTGDNLQELKKGDKEMVRVTPKKGYGKGYVRFADRKKQSELRKNPQIQSVTGTNYGEPYEGKYKTKPGEKNTVGDKDGDGTKEPNSHEYAGVKDKAIKNAMKKDDKKKDIKASFSNWRAGLTESQLMEISGEEKNKKITEKSVKNTIVINPELKEAVASLGGEVVDVQELTQEQVTEILKDQITENLAYLEELGIDIQEISANLALTASQKADEKRRIAANAGDRPEAAARAAQASRLYSKVGQLRARERASQAKK